MPRSLASSCFSFLLVILLTSCATSPDKDGLSGPSLEPLDEDLMGSGHNRRNVDTNEVNVGLGRYKQSF